MTHFEQEFFRPFKFSAGDIEQHLQNALRDLEIAAKDPFPEVQFSYSFQALIKAGITLLAAVGNVKVRSIPGHHVKILTKMSEILSDPDILAVTLLKTTEAIISKSLISEDIHQLFVEVFKADFQKVAPYMSNFFVKFHVDKFTL